MNVAITVWGNRISPVFDSAQTLLIAEICEDKVVDRKLKLFQATMFDRCLRLLKELNVRVLICGALCEGPVRMLESHDIEVIAFITGEAEEILECYRPGKRPEEICHARLWSWQMLPLPGGEATWTRT